MRPLGPGVLSSELAQKLPQTRQSQAGAGLGLCVITPGNAPAGAEMIKPDNTRKQAFEVELRPGLGRFYS